MNQQDSYDIELEAGPLSHPLNWRNTNLPNFPNFTYGTKRSILVGRSKRGGNIFGTKEMIIHAAFLYHDPPPTPRVLPHF